MGAFIFFFDFGPLEQGATLVGRWSNVITARAFTGPIIVSANTGPITARAETKVEL
jgi:hypothetical protein